MNQSTPKVFVGLPVYNEVKHISQALDSLINQTYSNLTIYISDNCSSDGTSEICQSYAAKDHRIKYHKNDENFKAGENYKRTLTIGTSGSCDYFMYARSEAILSPNLIKEMVNVLENDPKAALAFPRTVWIDENSKTLINRPVGFYDTSGYDVFARVALLLWTRPFQIYGLFRTQFVKSFSQRKWWQSMGFDYVFLFELALKGCFCHVENAKWYRRYKYLGETYKDRLNRYRKGFLRNTSLLDSLFPSIKMPYYCFKAVKNSKLKFADKLQCSIIIFFTAPLRYMVSKGKPIE